MRGKVQRENAAMAVEVVERLGWGVTEVEIKSGLEKAFLPGRFQVVEENEDSDGNGGKHGDNGSGGENNCNDESGELLILDGAHTVKSLAASLETLTEVMKEKRLQKINVLFACAEDKNMKGMAELLAKHKNIFDKIVLTRPGDFKKTNLERLKQAFSEAGLEVEVEPDFQKIVKKMQRPLYVVGSLYLCGLFKVYFKW